MGQLHLEDLIKQTGGCGRFQVILCFIVHSLKCVVCFSLMFMVFGGAKPDWWCADDMEGHNTSFTFTPDTRSFKSCTSINGSQPCSRFVFDGSMKTVATQWSLVCDLSWVPSTIYSIQFAGVLVGNLVCGQVADLIGKKKPLFFSVAVLVLLNVLSVFSTSWIMFAVIRFFIGLSIGFELTVQYNVMSEFANARWRTWIVSVPSWSVEVTIFAFVAWILHDWQHLHIVTAAIGAPLLATYWFVPESFRWYVGHDRLKDAENVIRRVAAVNRKPMPDMSEFWNASSTEQTVDRKYSVLDLLKDGELLKYSVLFLFVWITLGLCGYGIQYGVQALSGNLYINLFVIGLIGSPLQFLLIYLQNRIGRKKTSILFLIICALAAIVVAAAYRYNRTQLRDKLTNTTALIALIAINAAWSPIQTLTIETYPTVVRNMGFGLQNTMARVGAIIGPQLSFLDSKVAGMMYWISGTVATLSVLCILPIPETRGAGLLDKLRRDVEIEINQQQNEECSHKKQHCG